MSEELPESLRDPLRVIERGRRLLKYGLDCPRTAAECLSDGCPCRKEECGHCDDNEHCARPYGICIRVAG